MKKKRRSTRKPNTVAPSLREVDRERDTDAALAEFSDDYNEFYVDEVDDLRERREALRERNKEQKRPKKPVSPLRRKLIRIISYIAIISVVLVVGVVLSLTVLFKAQTYNVIGNTLYNESDIIDVCGIGEGENIFLAPKGPAERRIKEKFPYIEEVSVGFEIPDTIKIDITEAVEGYLVKVSDTEYLLISTKGRILDRVTDKSKYDLPIFIGPTLVSGEIGSYVRYEDETIVDIIQNISQVFADNGYQGITEIDATNPAAITFTYDGRIKVKLGIPEDLSYKIRTAMTIITENIDINPDSKIQGVLDVSRCNVTKRSYFNEQQIVDINASAPTQAPTESEDEYDDDEDSYDEDDYDWTEDEDDEYDDDYDEYDE